MSLKRHFDDTFCSHVVASDMRVERVAEIEKQRHVMPTLVGARLARDALSPLSTT